MEITKFRSPIPITLEQLAVHFRSVQRGLSELGRAVTNRRQRLRDALRAREDEMRELLGSSLDAIVVANADHRLIAANPKGRELFGISETNIRKFNIDAFLLPGQVPDLDGNSPRFIRQKERHDVCEIRRLDGGVRVAEYMLVANFLPLRHVYRFRKIVPVSPDLSRSPSLITQIASRRIPSTPDKRT